MGGEEATDGRLPSLTKLNSVTTILDKRLA